MADASMFEKTLYVGTENGLQILQKQAQGWQVQTTQLAGKPVIGFQPAIESGQGQPQTNLAAVRGYGVFRQTTTAQGWLQTLSANGHILLTSKTQPTALWLGTEPAGLFYSADGGLTWQDMSAGLQNLPQMLDWHYPWPPYQARVSALGQYQGAESAVWLAGVEIGGLYRSEDGGQSWQLSDSEGLLDEDVHTLVQHPKRPESWLAGTGDGVYLSEDGGLSWADISEGLEHYYCVDALILPSGAALLSASGTPPGTWIENATSTLYRAEGLGQPWQAVALPEPVFITTLCFDADAPQTCYFGTQRGHIYHSFNGGKTWHVCWEGQAGVLGLWVG